MTSNFQISNTFLEKLEFEVDHDFDDYLSHEKEKSILGIEAQVIKNHDEKTATVKLEVCVFYDFEKSPFKALVKYVGQFFWNDEVSEEQVDKMLQINAPATLFSYIRPHLSGITTSAGITPFVLPFMDFTNPKTIKK